MSDRRPDPDSLLERVRQEEAQRARGRLKIFLGAAPGVGKTYSMLEAAQALRREGRDLVVGYVETHGRPETAALLKGLELLPRRTATYRGAAIEEFDLDGGLRRHPSLILVDELAHRNAPGARHARRWQDVTELLEAGIDVYTTMNVQHLESLVDVVAQITGVTVRETVPDSVLEVAAEVELVDLPPDALLQRLREGKVYVPEMASRAIEHFFRRGNLLALRELALRCTAERVDAEMRTYRRDHGIAETWAAAERFLVCVGPNPLSARLIRATRRMAAVQRAGWTAVYVENSAQLRLAEPARAQVAANLHLAEQLGGETVILSGEDVAQTVLEFARSRNVTKIVVGKPTHPAWRDRLRGSLLDALVRGSGAIDVYAIRGEADEEPPPPAVLQQARQRWPALAGSVATVVVTTLVCFAMARRFELADLVMVYLLGVVFVAVRFGRRPSVIASFLSVAALDFFFVPPRLTFAVADLRHLVTFAVMLTVGLVTSTLAVRLRRQVEAARRREHSTAALYRLSRELVARTGAETLADAAASNISEVFHTRVAVLLPDEEGKLRAQAAGPGGFAMDEREKSVAQWVLDLQKPAGPGTDTLPGARALYLPLAGSRGSVGVLGVEPTGDGRAFDPEQRHLLEAFANHVAISIERSRLVAEAELSRMSVERERLRNSLLSSVSHDLRTPLAVITGAASELLDGEAGIEPTTRRDLLQTVHEEADRLNRLVGNLLDMTRLESGGVAPRREWTPIEEVIGGALTRMEGRLKERRLSVAIDPGVPMVPLDGVLIEQVLINLLDNALKYTPVESAIEIRAIGSPEEVMVEVADRGPGLAPGTEERIFDKFYRAPQGRPAAGVGLGLAICRGLVEAHGGRIWCTNREGGGAVFRFTLPVEGTPPRTEPEAVEHDGH